MSLPGHDGGGGDGARAGNEASSITLSINTLPVSYY